MGASQFPTPRGGGFRVLCIFKHNPSFDNAQWQTRADECDRIVWEDFWICLDYFLRHANELDFGERLNRHNHTPLFLYLAALIGDCFPVGSTGFCSGVYFVDSVHLG